VVAAGAGLVAVGSGLVSTPPDPPAGAAAYRLDHACRVVTTPGGFRVVEVTGTATTWVHRMPHSPPLAASPHRIRQRLEVRVERRVVGGWRGPRHRTTSAETGARTANTATAAVTERVGPTIGEGATWRVRARVRVLSVRDGLPDHAHWRYEVVGAPFSCAGEVDRVLFAPTG